MACLAQRCLNRADGLEHIGDAALGIEDVDLTVDLGNGRSATLALQNLRVCADFAGRIVFMHGVGHAALDHLCAADPPLTAADVSDALLADDALTDGSARDAAVSDALVQFQTLFARRCLRESPGDTELLSVSDFNHASDGVTPVVGSDCFLDALELVGTAEYDPKRGHPRCFGGMTALLEESLRVRGGEALLRDAAVALLPRGLVDTRDA